MAEVKKEIRNSCLDFVKGIACICVVFMHCEFPGKLGILIQCVSRFCVPFFFMVSGYFCHKETGKTNYGKKIRHIGIITICACVLYLLVTPIYQGGVEISAKDIFLWVVFNKPVYLASQLWFLFALLYDYICFALLERWGGRKIAYYAIPLGVLAYIFGAQGMHILGYNVPNCYYRNFLIEGFPLFSLGFCIHEKKDDIQVSNKLLIVGLILSTLLCPVERNLMGRDFGVNIVTFIQVSCLFLLCVKNPGIGKGRLFNLLGSKYSMYIYILHPAIWHLLEKLYAFLRFDTNMTALYLLPLFCLFITIVLAVFYVNIYGMIKSKVTVKKGQSHGDNDSYN